MGLLLSVLVACVGVIELISFYSNVRRNFTLLPVSGDLSTVRENYVRELSGIRKHGESDLQSSIAPASKANNTVPTFRLNSHEDIEIEYNKHILAKSRTPSPRRFLVSEKEVDDAQRRHFVLSEEPQGISRSQCKTSIPEFFIEEQRKSKKSPEHPRYVLTDHEGRSASPIPLPSQFLITEKELNSLEFADIPSNSKSEYNQDYYRRSPSPYPPLDLPRVPRNSICNELVDNNSSVLEEDEDPYKSRSSSPQIAKSSETTLIPLSGVSVERNVLATTVIKRAKSILESENNGNKSVCTEYVVKASCSTEVNNGSVASVSTVEDVQEDFLENATYDENYLNNLDGVGKQKCVKRSFSSRRSSKRLLTSNSVEESCSQSDESSRQDSTGSSSIQAVENVDSDVSPKALNANPDIPSTSKEPEMKKQPEPFWLIFSGEYTKAMNKDWHGQHFCCWQCDESLTGQRYVLRDDHPYCVSCYESVFANACEKCSRIIGIDSKDLSYKDKHWHEACFLCTTCGESLVDKQFGSKGDRIYCGSCYDQQFASRCDGCHEIFRAGTKKMEYKTRQWHEKCFCCCVCKVPIGTQSFIPREQEIYCAKCYEEKFATRCIKCNKVITSGGVTYKNEPWHRECFTCTHCQKSLAGERFTSRDEKPFCAECFGELFAKRCTACNKPITGIGGTKFISFEDRHWHNDCFFCASCRTSLVGRGFITDNEDIICPECAKQKLM